MKNIPNKIYLQVGDEDDLENVDFNELADVSWCQDQIFDTDLVYYHRKNINWKQLREKYFKECTHNPMPISTNTDNPIKINMAPHDLFEWFKRNVQNA
jgi:hypothetical protein